MNKMDIIEIIEKKKNKKELTKEEIYYFVEGVTNQSIPDYQQSALLMAICINGMNYREIKDLTMAMTYSGYTLDLTSVPGVVLDKHSTGGVGDKTTLIIGPIMASLGVPVAKMSGRGLGITGGTIDKLEAIPGFSSNVSEEQFIEALTKVGFVDGAQTKSFAPADKYLYALRDVTGTVQSIPLIVSSIMSKKLALFTDGIVLDVKCGSGAFMETREDAEELAGIMIEVGKLAKRKCKAVVSDMNEPLGYTVGNILEVVEAVQFLRGTVQNPRLKTLVITLCSEMYKLYLEQSEGVPEMTDEKIEKLILKSIDSGKAYKKFKEFVTNQGGDVSFIDSIPDTLEELGESFVSSGCVEIKAKKSGTICGITAHEVGRASQALGAGRITKDDEIDMGAGIVFKKTVSDEVSEGDVIALIYADDKYKLKSAKKMMEKAITIKSDLKEPIHNDIIICKKN